MQHAQHSTNAGWSASHAAAMVGADPVRQAVHTVEGPTLHSREPAFDLGLAAVDRAPTCFGRSSRASARSLGPGRIRAVRRCMSRLAMGMAASLMLVGCGGEPTELLNTPSDSAPPPATTTPGTTVAGGETPGVNEIANASAEPGTLVKISAITPKKFAAAHCSKVIIVLLYQPDSLIDESIYREARAATKDLKDVVTLAYTPSDVKAFGDLPAKLGLLSTPGLAIVDRSGRIEAFWTSYVDQQLIAYQLDRAASARPCKVSEADVPAAGSALNDAALVAAGGKPASATAAANAAAAATAATGAGTTDASAVLTGGATTAGTVPNGTDSAGTALTSAPGTAAGIAADANASPSLNPGTTPAAAPIAGDPATF